MIGWVLVGIGALTVVQELWWHPRSMAKAREKVARRDDPSKFAAFLDSRWHKLLRWSGLAMGAGIAAIGLLVLAGVGK
jgi:hypothetical protein